ncbi:transmembrane amino acid transporter protein-domain-containing protein [Lipomyces arxii]|uniref:transmembrane amino acid transporter protein-domain-containing protein n=1 Tax=Lipomyces arxii TaxID=56418 RepID=UPI0034CDCD96
MATEQAVLVPHTPPANAAVVEYIEDEEDEDFNVNHLSDDDDGHKKTHIGTASAVSSVANLSNTILGAGILAMPFAIRHDGIFFGFLVILVAALTSGAGLFLQYRCSRYVERGSASFFALSQSTYPQLAVWFDTAIAIKCFGVGVSYLIIIGDLMPQVIADFFFGYVEVPDTVAESRRIWISIFMIFIIPLCFLRKLDSLKYTSVIALLAIGYLSVLVVSHWMIGDTIPYRGEISMGPVSLTGLLSTLPIVVFGFTCHQNMFSIVNEIKDSRPTAVLTVIMSSIGSAFVLYTIVGFTGYFSFGDNLTGNIIGMYPTSFSSAVGRAAIVILVMLSFPLQCHPCRASLDHIFTHFISSDSPSGGRAHTSKGRFIFLTMIIIFFSYLLAMAVTSLEVVLAFVGATGSTSISFILPGIFGYKLLGSPYHLPLPDAKVDGDDELGPDEELPAPPQAVRLVTPDAEDAREALRGEFGEGYYIKYGSLALASWGFFIMIVCMSTNIYLLL